MTRRIVLTSSKGGTGKTTTALHLAVALAEKGRHTLLVDLDPQGAIGLALAKGDTEWGGLVEIMLAGTPAADVVVATSMPTLRILPRGRLDPVDAAAYELRLQDGGFIGGVLDRFDGDLDYIILDTPSGLGPVTRAALACSRFALVPLQAEPVALRTLGQTLRVVEHVRATENPGLQLLGILPTMVEFGTEASLNVMASIWSGFGGVLDTAIPRSAAFGAASELGVPVGFLGGRTPPEGRRFAILAEELEGRMQDMSGDQDEQEPRRLV